MEKQWDLIRYHWEMGEDGWPRLRVEEIIRTYDEFISIDERLAIVTNYVNANEPHAKDFRWCNTTGDAECWEYYQYGQDSFMTPVYAMAPTSERDKMLKKG